MKCNYARRVSFERLQAAEFDRIFGSVQLQNTPAIQIEFQSLLDFMGDLSGKRVLDLGCGIGRMGLRLSAYADAVIGYDLSPVAVARANDLASQLGITNFRAEVNNFCHPEPDSFDVVLCVNMLHHASDPEAVLAAVKKALKPGGRLVVLENNPLNPLFPVFFFLIGQVKAHFTKQYLLVNRFSLSSMILRSGLKISGFKRHGFLPTSLYNISLSYSTINNFLNSIPLINEFTAFHFLMADKPIEPSRA